jgi:carbon-monoxide dehydrogenase small subunit
MILAAKALLDDHPHPTEDEIRRALAGNVCRCTGYIKIVEAVKSAAGVMAAGNFGEAHSQKPENQE